MTNFEAQPVPSQLASSWQSRYSSFITMVLVISATAIAVAAEQLSYLKFSAFILIPVGLYYLFIRPELALVLAFSSAIFKEWLSLNVPFFSQFDFTIAVFLLAMISTFFYLLRKNWLFSIDLPPSALPLLLFTGYMIFSVSYSLSVQYGTFKSFSFLFFNWALFFFPILIVRDENSAIKIAKILIAIAIPVAIYTLYSLIKSILAGSIIFTYRSSFLGVNPISYANWIGAAAICLMVMIPLMRRREWRILGYLGLLLLLVTMFAANSRGPMMSFIVAFLILMSIRYHGKSKRNLVILGIIVIIFVVIIFSVLPEQVTSRYTDILSGEKTSKNLTFFTVYTRLYSWKAAWELATDRWFHILFGVGCGGYSQTVFRQDIRWYPHNIFLEVFSELGLLGLFLLTWHFASVFSTGINTYRSTLPERTKAIIIAFLLCALFNFIGAQFSGDLNDNRRLWFFLGLVVACANFIRKQKQESSHEDRLR